MAQTLKKLPPVEQLRGRTLGRILIKMRALTRNKVHECLKIQKQKKGTVRIGQIFLEEGLVDEKQLRIALAAQRGMEYVDISDDDIPLDIIEKVPPHMARNYNMVPIEYKEDANQLIVALDNSENFRATDDLSSLMGYDVVARITDSETLESLLQKYYQDTDETEEISELIGEIQGDEVLGGFDGRNQSIDLDEL